MYAELVSSSRTLHIPPNAVASGIPVKERLLKQEYLTQVSVADSIVPYGSLSRVPFCRFGTAYSTLSYQIHCPVRAVLSRLLAIC